MENFDQIELLNTAETFEEFKHEFVPQTFDEYLGQAELKKKLHVYTTAAKQREEPLDHMLLFGPPGLGKTTLSQIMAQVMDVDIKICSGPMMERTGDLVAILSGLDMRDILFIDEIHRMPRAVEEVLYSAMEHFRVDVIIGQGAGAKTVNLPIAPFTLIGATTKSGALSAPLRSRFGITERLEFYTEDELTQIVLQSAKFLETKISTESATKISKCARGTPRVAKKILRRVRDFAQVNNNNQATPELVDDALKFLGLDQDGLSSLDNVLLRRMLDTFNGGPVGLETLASILSEDRETVETVYEPYLMRKGFLERTPRGRQIPAKAQIYLRKKFFGQQTTF
jgi:Holliday junction DNA helicase RuvB